MAFNFLDLPLLSREEIIREMNQTDLYVLSLRSERVYKIACSTRKFDANRMVVIIEDAHAKIQIFDIDDIKHEKAIVTWNFDGKNFRKRTEWAVNGFKMDKNKKSNTFKVSSLRINDAIDAVISYWLKLFPNCQIDELFIDLNGQLIEKMTLSKALKSIKNVETVKMTGDDQRNNSKFITSNINISKHYSNSSKQSFHAETGESLKCVDRIKIANANWMSKEVLLNLNCAHIEIGRTGLLEEDMKDFIRKWKNSTGDEMAKIRYVEIGRPPDVPVPGLAEFKGALWQPNNPNAVYLRNPNMHRYFSLWNGLDIVKADGTVATFFQHSWRFDTWYFAVWTDDFELTS